MPGLHPAPTARSVCGMSHGLLQLGTTRQQLLRLLLASPGGCTVEDLCLRLRVTHNAVRQHLNALASRGEVERVAARPTGGRPQTRYAITAEGRDLFPRNYGTIAGALIAQLATQLGDEPVGQMLADLGTSVAAMQPPLQVGPGDDGPAKALAERLDSLGYEAGPARGENGEWEVESFNCVFHAMARRNPQVCRFDLAYMEAVTGKKVEHRECMVRGAHSCRFRIATDAPEHD